MTTQAEKARLFQDLHHQDHAFIIPNPWYIGTARLLAHMGFKALASSSAGYAFSMGVPDCEIGRQGMLEHLTALSAATDLPVSADLENGRSEEHTSELQSLMRISYAVFCLKK